MSGINSGDSTAAGSHAQPARMLLLSFSGLIGSDRSAVEPHLLLLLVLVVPENKRSKEGVSNAPVIGAETLVTPVIPVRWIFSSSGYL